MTDLTKLRADLRMQVTASATTHTALSGAQLRALLDALDAAEARDYRKLTALGVGNGYGSLFVYGEYDAIKAAQDIVFRAEKAEREPKGCMRGQSANGTQFCAEAVNAMRERDAARDEATIAIKERAEVWAELLKMERERDEARALLDKAPVVSMFYTNHGLDAVSFTDAYHSWKDEVREWKDRTP